MTILNTSVSGMLADSNWLSSISQNVANANTTGYKNAETDFSTLVDQVSTAAAGGGVMTTTRNLNSLQGNVVSSSTATNLAVQGSGFFVVSDSSGATYLTRNGSFVPDASGNLVNSAGYYLMGTDIQSGSAPPANALSTLQKVNVNSAGETATPTTSASIAANLAFERDPDRRRRPALGELCELDLHRRHVARRLRQSRRGAHHQSLSRQHRRKHLGGRRLRRIESCNRRRFSVFLRPSRDGNPHLRSDDRLIVLRLSADDSRSRRTVDEPRSQQPDPARRELSA